MGAVDRPSRNMSVLKHTMNDKLKFTYESEKQKLNVMYLEGDELQEVKKNEWKSAGDSFKVSTK